VGKRLLLFDEDSRWARFASETLIKEGHDVFCVATFDGLVRMLAAHDYDVVIADINFSAADPDAALRELCNAARQAEVIVCTARPSLRQATYAGKLGVSDYVDRTEHLSALAVLRKHLVSAPSSPVEGDVANDRAVGEPTETTAKGVFRGIVSRNWRMQGIFELIQTISTSSVNVLIEGETGTGKELVAHAIHDCSTRRNGPFVTLDCSTLAHELLESELFGHEKGAFTGAVGRHIGRFERADGGTLFLDEVANITLPVQAKLLRVLETRTFERVGGQKPIAVDVRIVAASNRPLDQCVADGAFREDLYHRLNVVQILIPPLRQRKEDVPLLVEHFIHRFAREYRKEVQGVTSAALHLLSAYHWPGNVRELENVILQSVILTHSSLIDVMDLPPRIWGIHEQTGGDVSARLADRLREPEKEILLSTLKQVNGNIKQAAKQLQISRTTLYAKLKRYGIEPHHVAHAGNVAGASSCHDETQPLPGPHELAPNPDAASTTD